MVVGAGGAEVFGRSIPAASLWSYLIAASTLAAAALAPVLGAVADCSGSKKGFLAAFTALGCLGTLALTASGPGTVALSAAAFFAANIGFAGAFAFYNAFLPELASKEEMGRVSGLGWAMGYLGGGLCLALNLAMIRKPGWFGIPDAAHLPVRLGFAVVAAWWALFSLPFFLKVRERAPKRRLGRRALAQGLERLRHTFREVRRFPELCKFLVAFLLFNDGIETVIVMAGVFAAEVVGMGQGEIIQCFLLIQAVAFLGSLLFGRLADRIGDKPAVLLTLAIWAGVLGWALFIRTAAQFWWAGAVIGLVLGGSQSASRAMFASFTPAGNSAEFFGFLSLSGKMVAAVGPIVFGLARQFTGSVRLATFSILAFFIAGALVLAFVDEAKGKRESEVAVA